MTTPRHNQHSFFKYYTPESAKLTLRNGSRKWSTPLQFNDPFDNQFDIGFPEPPAEVVAQKAERILTALRSPEPLKPSQFGAKTAEMELLRQLYQHNPGIQFTDDDIAYLQGGVLQGMHNVRRTAPEFNAEVRRIMSDTSIFCVSETPDNILMWSHYAANHTGAVVEFRAAEEVDSPLLVAQPVRYSEDMPHLNYDILEMDSKLARIEIFDTVTLSKSHVWAYEREWRVWSTLRDKTKAFEIIPFSPKEIEAVYLGCKISSDDREQIAEIMSNKYPTAKIFMAETHPSRFELIFRP
jgi:hypothetical protein